MCRFSPAIVLVALSCLASAQDSTRATAFWTAFRSHYPYHTQMITVSPAATDGTRILIVPEPPPHVTLEEFEVQSPELQNAVVHKHPIGHDGWVKDIVVQLPDTTPEQLRSLTVKLSHYLFFTSYKASATEWRPTSLMRSKNAALKTDLTLPATVLRHISTGRFTPLYGGSSSPMDQLLDRRRSGVFFSSTPGVVAWIVSRKQDLISHRDEARQFSLDSDLLIGAIGHGDMVAILGRERIIPSDVLPPLRTETILLLASVNSDELAQSYERTNFVAGKFDEARNLDWAPIFLSDSLVDTEYGSLLNITDQLLKSWSLKGEVKYENFDYPSPRLWPFPQPLTQLVEADTLTFNWNTKGTGYSVDGPDSLIGIYRTGALPVSYLAEGENDSVAIRKQLLECEFTAYDYFAGTGDPNLARVVQYAALYQIFRAYTIHSQTPQQVVNYNHEPLESEIHQVITKFAQLDPKNLDATLDKVSGKDVGLLQALSAISQIEHVEELQQLIASIQVHEGAQGIERLAQHVSSPRQHMNQTVALYDKISRIVTEEPESEQEKSFEELNSAKHVVSHLGDVNPQGVLSHFDQQERDELAIDLTARELETHKGLILFLTGTSLRSLKDAYEESMQRPDALWIHTPAIVVSTHGDNSFGETGGHNIDSQVVQFRMDATVSSGNVRILEANGSRSVLINESDAWAVADLSRIVGRLDPTIPASDIQSILNDVMRSALPPRPIPENRVLGFSDAVKPDLGRGLQVHSTLASDEVVGYRTSVRPSAARDNDRIKAVSSNGSVGTIVERKSLSSLLIYHGATGHVIEATDTASAMEALQGIARTDASGGFKTRIVFQKGFSEDEALGYMASLRAKLAGDTKASGRAVAVEGGVELDNLSPNQLSRFISDTDFDYSGATITEDLQEGTVLDGDMEVRRLLVDIPNRTRSKPSLRLRISLFFKRGTASVAQALDDAKQVITETIKRFTHGGSTDPVLAVATELHGQLVDRFGKEGVRIHIADQGTDFLITERGDGGVIGKGVRTVA